MKKEFKKVFCMITIHCDDCSDFTVQMYDEPLFSSDSIGEWRYYEDRYNDGFWFYDFSYKPAMSEIFEVLLPKLQELGFLL